MIYFHMSQTYAYINLEWLQGLNPIGEAHFYSVQFLRHVCDEILAIFIDICETLNMLVQFLSQPKFFFNITMRSILIICKLISGNNQIPAPLCDKNMQILMFNVLIRKNINAPYVFSASLVFFSAHFNIRPATFRFFLLDYFRDA